MERCVSFPWTRWIIGLNAGVADTGGATAAALQNLETLPNDAVQDSIHASSGSQSSHVIFPEGISIAGLRPRQESNAMTVARAFRHNDERAGQAEEKEGAVAARAWENSWFASIGGVANLLGSSCCAVALCPRATGCLRCASPPASLSRPFSELSRMGRRH